MAENGKKAAINNMSRYINQFGKTMVNIKSYQTESAKTIDPKVAHIETQTIKESETNKVEKSEKKVRKQFYSHKKPKLRKVDTHTQTLDCSRDTFIDPGSAQ